MFGFVVPTFSHFFPTFVHNLKRGDFYENEEKMGGKPAESEEFPEILKIQKSNYLQSGYN